MHRCFSFSLITSGLLFQANSIMSYHGPLRITLGVSVTLSKNYPSCGLSKTDTINLGEEVRDSCSLPY